MIEKTIKVTAITGIHARLAKKLVNKAGQYKSEITLQYKKKSVNLKSIMGVMSLGVAQGAEVLIKAEGVDAEQALAEMEKLINKGLGK